MIKRDELSDTTSCLNKATDSERLFVLLARDPAAPVALRAWVAERVRLGKNTMDDGQIQEALECAHLMEIERAEIESTRRQQKICWPGSGPASRAMKISSFLTVEGHPFRVDASWQDLVALLSTTRRTECSVSTCSGKSCPHKKGPCWSPATFIAGPRVRSTVAVVSALALDVDNQPETAVAAMRDRLARYQHVIHASHADRADDRCLRIVVQLSRDVSPGEWSLFWQAATHALGFSPLDGSPLRAADPVCSDVARIYYLPSRPRDADFFVVTHDGEALDVDAILASREQEVLP